jgi:hypothetical protein
LAFLPKITHKVDELQEQLGLGGGSSLKSINSDDDPDQKKKLSKKGLHTLQRFALHSTTLE